MQFFIHNTKLFLEQSIYFSNQRKWGFLEYKICKKCVFFSKVLAQNSSEQHADLLCLEQDNDSEEKCEEYGKKRSELEKIYAKIAEDVKI